MSLLMEALRKAEEAKRKAAQQKQEASDAAPHQSASASEATPPAPPPSSTSAPESGLSLMDNAELDRQYSQDTGEEDDSNGAAPEAGEQEAPPGQPGQDTSASPGRFESLHDYVSAIPRPTRPRQRPGLAELDYVDETEVPEPAVPDTASQLHTQETDSTEAEAPNSLAQAFAASAERAQPEASPETLAARATVQQRQSQERQNQDSAGAVFRAKTATQHKLRQRRQRALLLSLLLLFPAGGLAIWLYNAYLTPALVMAPSGFIDAGNRSLSDTEATAEVDPSSATEDNRNIDNSPETDTAALGTPAQPPSPETSPAGIPAPETAPAQTATAPAPEAGAGAGAEDNASDPAEDMTTQLAQLPDGGTSTLRVSRTDSSMAVAPALSRAYRAFQQGDLSTAGNEYQNLLEQEPNNRDALLGLASVHRREGNTARAQGLYARLLQLNPRDPLARAGLIDAAQSADPLRRESDLKNLEDEFPDLAPISFALGNLYAAQQRWSQAQSAYFEALRKARNSGRGPISPDYAFNLAISLERINQPGPALSYYEEALTLAQNATPGFDLNLLNQRLTQLQQASP